MEHTRRLTVLKGLQLTKAVARRPVVTFHVSLKPSRRDVVIAALSVAWRTEFLGVLRYSFPERVDVSLYSECPIRQLCYDQESLTFLEVIFIKLKYKNTTLLSIQFSSFQSNLKGDAVF